MKGRGLGRELGGHGSAWRGTGENGNSKTVLMYNIHKN